MDDLREAHKLDAILRNLYELAYNDGAKGVKKAERVSITQAEIKARDSRRDAYIIGEDRAAHADWCGEYEHASEQVVCSCGYWTENELRAEQRRRSGDG